MKTQAQIIFNEWRQWSRDSRMRWLMAAMLLLSVIALVLQFHFYTQMEAKRSNAQEQSRKAWLRQGLKHPHIAAHFGNYAYKRPAPLFLFDAGITVYTGTAVYMEPHRQNDFLLSGSQETDTGARFGWLGPALICQMIIPLFIVLLSFNSVTGEKLRGTYPLLMTHGLSVRRLLLAKILAVFIFFFLFLTVYLLVIAVLAHASMKAPAGFSIVPFIYLWLIFSVYYAFWSGGGIIVSAVARNERSAISMLLLCWVVTNVIVPKMAANLAEDIYPLSTNYKLKKQISVDIENGLDGHDSRSARAKTIEDSVLKANKADSVQHLNFNFEGYIMERGEEYSSAVYDKNINLIFNTLKNQRNLQSWVSIASPFLIVRNISMAASNASVETEIDFQQQAEYYRRSFVQALNNDMMLHSAYGDWDKYKVKNSVYGTIKPFSARPHTLPWALQYVRKENVFLLCWMVGISFCLLFVSKKL